VVLGFVEIGGFERTGVSESHEETDPSEGDDAWPIRVGLGDSDSLGGGGPR
jgi:hypothetical protein